jgi:hypothetical protein
MPAFRVSNDTRIRNGKILRSEQCADMHFGAFPDDALYRTFIDTTPDSRIRVSETPPDGAAVQWEPLRASQRSGAWEIHSITDDAVLKKIYWLFTPGFTFLLAPAIGRCSMIFKSMPPCKSSSRPAILWAPTLAGGGASPRRFWQHRSQRVSGRRKRHDAAGCRYCGRQVYFTKSMHQRHWASRVFAHAAAGFERRWRAILSEGNYQTVNVVSFNPNKIQPMWK